MSLINSLKLRSTIMITLASLIFFTEGCDVRKGDFDKYTKGISDFQMKSNLGDTLTVERIQIRQGVNKGDPLSLIPDRIPYVSISGDITICRNGDCKTKKELTLYSLVYSKDGDLVVEFEDSIDFTKTMENFRASISDCSKVMSSRAGESYAIPWKKTYDNLEGISDLDFIVWSPTLGIISLQYKTEKWDRILE